MNIDLNSFPPEGETDFSEDAQGIQRTATAMQSQNTRQVPTKVEQ
jgi:hypothetical protein